MKKKILALFLCLAMVLSLVACGSSNAENSQTPETDPAQSDPAQTDQGQDPATSDLTPAEKIVDSYYSYSYNVGTMLMSYYFHFHDDIPSIGPLYYAGFAMNQITFTGTYEVVEQEREYHCWPDRAAVEAAGEGGEPPVGTAPYTVNFYDFDGNLVDSCAFDGDILYMDMTNITGIGGGNVTYIRDPEPETSDLASDYAGEKSVSLLSLIDPNDETATLDLLADGKYNDTVIMFVEGTYTMNEDKSEITLTPKSASDSGAVVTKNEDGTYTYKSDDGAEVVLKVVSTISISYLYKGKIEVPGAGVSGDLLCELYDDGTVRLYASVFGNESDIDAATYEVDEAANTITIHFENAGDVAISTDAESFDYTLAGHDFFGDINETLTFATE